ncbi:MAG: ribonuclease protein component [Betaproteobacteria bacterium]|nr:ribonuclease protein component [Betaproteobacteria bacterium]MEA3158169.1 ribonuclease protein component [Betaproteobacteria bacterium]
MSKSTVVTRPGVLRKGSEFEAVLRSGLRVASRNFVMRACANGVGQTRVGIIAGRKAASRAVDRNRGKRLIREAFRIPSALIACDVTVQLRTDLRSEHNSTVRAELQHLIASLVRRCTVVSSDNVLEQRAPSPNRQ